MTASSGNFATAALTFLSPEAMAFLVPRSANVFDNSRNAYIVVVRPLTRDFVSHRSWLHRTGAKRPRILKRSEATIRRRVTTNLRCRVALEQRSATALPAQYRRSDGSSKQRIWFRRPSNGSRARRSRQRPELRARAVGSQSQSTNKLRHPIFGACMPFLGLRYASTRSTRAGHTQRFVCPMPK